MDLYGAAGQIDLTNGPVTMDLTLMTTTVAVTVRTNDGNLARGGFVSSQPWSGSTPVAPGVRLGGQTWSRAPINENGVAHIPVLVGQEYHLRGGNVSAVVDNICAFPTDSAPVCLTAPLVVGEGTAVTLPQPTILPPPNDLSAVSPTNLPSLRWAPVTYAHHYAIYRDGVNIGSTNATTYSDTEAVDGARQYAVATVDTVGREGPVSAPVQVLVDKTAPVLGTFAWTANPMQVGAGTTLSVPASDEASGVAGGEYFLNTDPGPGNGIALSWNGTDLTSAAFGTGLQPGVHLIGARARDAVGNWSPAVTTYLVVFDPAGPHYVVGQRNLRPGGNDVLPWISSAPSDFATFAFNMNLTSTGAVAPSSEFEFRYVERGSCHNSCRSFVLTADNFQWLAISDGYRGTFQGNAVLDVNGASTNVVFHVRASDGDRLTPKAPDTFELTVYPQSSNPADSAPLYRVSADFTPGTGNANGGVRIK